MKRAPLACLLLLLSTTAVGGSWTDLWLTPDQHGQRLLSSGRAAEAASVFADPRRRAYAELAAGKYADAAQRLAPFKDAESEYNRGNALAHSGDLAGALAAYDASLAQRPSDRDTRHNRELVARALQQRGQQQGAPGKSTGQGHSQSPHSQSGAGQQAGPGGSTQQGATGSSGGNPGAADARGPSGTAQGQPGTAASQSGTASGQSGTASGQLANAQMAQPAAKGQQQQPSAANRDLAAAGAPVQPESARLADPRLSAAGAKSAPPPEQSEQSLSLDQWLRRIPDDPAELLQRKFMLEHRLRQKQDSP